MFDKDFPIFKEADLLLNPNDRKVAFNIIAQKVGVSPIIIEKDFWVCFLLQKLFEDDELKDKLIFKGGTSLSKVYNLINRFSEDVDITINRSLIGIDESKTGKNLINHVENKCKNYIKKYLEPILSLQLSKQLKGQRFELIRDKSILHFYYPCNEQDYSSIKIKGLSKVRAYDYIKPSVKIELGSYGGISPTENKTVSAYANNCFAINLTVLDINRSFFEKISILHSVFFRPLTEKLDPGYSRHYYDVYMFIESEKYKKSLAKKAELWDTVIINNNKFYLEAWEPFSAQNIKTICLVPDEERLLELKEDYKKMEIMFFKEFPSFEEIICALYKLEIVINE